MPADLEHRRDDCFLAEEHRFCSLRLSTLQLSVKKPNLPLDKRRELVYN
jgi:hypothetical protein